MELIAQFARQYPVSGCRASLGAPTVHVASGQITEQRRKADETQGQAVQGPERGRSRSAGLRRSPHHNTERAIQWLARF